MCYGAGFTAMGLTEFMVITGLARLPALFASIFIGAQASRGGYRLLILTVIVALVAVTCYYFYERCRNARELMSEIGQVTRG